MREMSMAEKKRKILILISLFVIVIVSLSAIIKLKQLKTLSEVAEKHMEIIEKSNWPLDDVPLIKRLDVEVTQIEDDSWSIYYDSGVSYSEYKNYLVELYEAGFKPVQDTSSRNPKYLHDELGDDTIEIFWQGEKEGYGVEVYFGKIGAETKYGYTIEDNFMMSLFKYSEKNTSNDESGDTFDENESGDTFDKNESGEVGIDDETNEKLNDFSGDTLIDNEERDDLIESSGDELNLSETGEKADNVEVISDDITFADSGEGENIELDTTENISGETTENPVRE